MCYAVLCYFQSLFDFHVLSNKALIMLLLVGLIIVLKYDVVLYDRKKVGLNGTHEISSVTFILPVCHKRVSPCNK